MSAEGPSSIVMTGAGGFVGRRLAIHLAKFAAPGARLTAIERSEPPAGWDGVRADVTDEAAVARIVATARPDVVVHLAAQSSVGAAETAAKATWRTNFEGSFALAAACSTHAPHAVVLFASSAEVYGASFGDVPLDEDAPLRPRNPYGRSKAAAEQAMADVLAPTNRLIVSRAFNHTGAGQDERFALPSFAAQIARIEAGAQPPVMKVGNLDAERDFLHVEDVCDAYLALLGAAPRLPFRSVFNISSGAARPIRAYLEEMKVLSGAEFKIEIDPERTRAIDIPKAAGRNDRMRISTGWLPKRAPAHFLEELLTFARDNLKRQQ